MAALRALTRAQSGEGSSGRKLRRQWDSAPRKPRIPPIERRFANGQATRQLLLVPLFRSPDLEPGRASGDDGEPTAREPSCPIRLPLFEPHSWTRIQLTEGLS